MGKYFSTRIKPTLPVAGQIQSDASDLVFAGGDIMFDWTAFEIPRGTARLIDVSIIMRGSQTVKGMDLFFAKTDPDGSTAPGSLGTVNATANGSGYYRNVIGTVHLASGTFKEDLDNLTVGSMGHGGGTGQVPSVVLQGVESSGSNPGFDKLYIGGTVSAGSGYNFSTGVVADGAVSAGAARNFDVKTVSALNFFDVGDTVHVHDSDTAIGTIKSLTATNIILETVTGVAIADEDEIINASPIELILSFEK
tara:strand:- start:1112 stop:1864 length:753 start_codon:yes stop_codon:yes gene_type:complete